MAEGARDQSDEEYTSHLTPDQPITSAKIASMAMSTIMQSAATRENGQTDGKCGFRSAMHLPCVHSAP
jgi:hypothetical protein